MECPANTFTGIHVYRDSAIGPACKHCHGMKRAIEGQDRALSAQPAWRERAETALADLIASGEPFTSEDITATVGLLRTATTGARTEIEDNQIRVFDASNVLRVRIGVW